MAVVKRIEGGYKHWCQGCGCVHRVPDGWTFNDDLDVPTFAPSVKITCKQLIIENGRWTGGWVRDANGDALDGCCHYFIEDGQIKFCSDCTHPMSGQTAALLSLAEWPFAGELN